MEDGATAGKMGCLRLGTPGRLEPRGVTPGHTELEHTVWVALPEGWEEGHFSWGYFHFHSCQNSLTFK